MEMSLNQIAVQLAAPHGKEFDTPTIRMIKDRVIVMTERMIKNALDKSSKDRKFYRSPLFVLKLTPTSVGCFPVVCTVMETEDLPLPFRANGIMFDFVGSADGRSTFTEAAMGIEQYIAATKYASRRIRYRWVGKRIQILNNFTDKIGVMGIWLDPRVIAKYFCEGDRCDPDSEPFRIGGDILQLVMMAVAQELREGMEPKETEKEVTIADDKAV